MRRPLIALAGIALAATLGACTPDETNEPTGQPVTSTTPTAPATAGETDETPTDETPMDNTPPAEPTAGDTGPATTAPADPPGAQLDGASAVLVFNDQHLSTTDAVTCRSDGGNFEINRGDATADDEFLTISMTTPDAETVESISMVHQGWMFAVDPPNGRGSAAVSTTPEGYEFAGSGEVRHIDDQETLEEVDYTLVVACP